MEEKAAGSNFEACLQFINSKFDYYKRILDADQQACNRSIDSIREQALSCNGDDEQLRSITGLGTIELANQLDYLEQEALKTYEENKTCLLKMFQNLLNLHREFAFDEVLLNERRIAASFQYRPSLLPNIEKLRLSKPATLSSSSSMHSVISNTDRYRLIFAPTPTPKTPLPTPVHSTSFSKRADIETFQQKQESLPSKSIHKLVSPIESNEIDLTKLIRETNPNSAADPFKFSKISQNWQQQQQSTTSAPVKKVPKHTLPCDDALLAAANKRFVLLHNMNTSNVLYVFDTQKDETKEYHWDEGHIQSLGHADSNLFYIITSTKIFLYDIIKENLDKQYFLYDTLYKDLLLITDDLSYQTALKRNNQIQSTAFDDFCYYLYTNKEYDQLLIKCSLDSFHEEARLNLTKRYPEVQYILGFTVANKSLVTFLSVDTHGYHLFFCDESQNYNLIKKLPIPSAADPTRVVTTFSPNIPIRASGGNRGKAAQSGKQLWFVLDRQANCVHCLAHERYLTKIPSASGKPLQSLTLFDNKLVLAYNELSVDIIDLDNYFSSLQL